MKKGRAVKETNIERKEPNYMRGALGYREIVRKTVVENAPELK